jgi:hypothetical protein
MDEDIVPTLEERNLILMIRKVYRYGEITITTHNGQPKQVHKTIVRTLLSDLSPEDFDELK